MYHLSIKPVSRATGRSATAAAAYRAACLIEDERTGDIHDYTRKAGVEHSEIILPPGAPSWEHDRAALWNAAERAEKRKDARVAREYEVAIPKELTLAQGIALVRDFGQALADRYGVAVDFNVHQDHRQHWDGSEKGFVAYHAHVLTTTRKLGRDGFGEKATPELSDTKRKSLGLDDGAAEIERTRQAWEQVANRHLAQAGHRQQIDCRSLKAQGIEREPTVHLGPVVTALERGTRGREPEATRLGDANRRIIQAYRDGQQAREALQAITHNILVLDGDLQQAVAERDRQRAVAAQALRDTRTVRPPVAAVSAQALVPAPAPAPAPAAPKRVPVATNYLAMNDAEMAMLVGPALNDAVIAHGFALKAEQVRALTEQSARAAAALPEARAALVAIDAQAPEAPTGLTALFKQSAYEAAHVEHVERVRLAKAEIGHHEQHVLTPEAVQRQATQWAQAEVVKRLPLASRALAGQQAREARQQQQAVAITTRFAQFIQRYGEKADTDPQWQALPAGLQRQIRLLQKAQRLGGDAAVNTVLSQLRQQPDSLQALHVAMEEGDKQLRALARAKAPERGRGR